MKENIGVVAIILAAGQSKRMGAPKLLLPWGSTTVLGQVVRALTDQADSETDKRITDIIVVTGGWRAEVETEVKRLQENYSARAVFNAEHEHGGMLASIQVGLRAACASATGALIVLGDQPQVGSRTVREILRVFEEHQGHLIVPSYRRRRGHPFLIPQKYWDELLQLEAPSTLRDFLNAHAGAIIYVEADKTVLQDLDTPEDYQRAK